MRKSLFALLATLSLAGCGGTPLPPVAAGVAGRLEAQAIAPIGPAAAMARSVLSRNSRGVTLASAPARVIVAGSGHFGALWARDAMFASLGLLAVGETAVVRDSLAALLDHQRADGLVPRRIGNGSNALGILRNAMGLGTSDSAAFGDDDFVKASVDAPALVVWVASEYVKATGDEAFLARYRPALARCCAYLTAHEDGGLLEQAAYADWKDMNARSGKVLYSNALYYQALTALGELATRAGDPAAAADDQARAAALGERIRGAFWNASAGRFRDSLELDGFSPEGDLFAVLFGIATPAQRQAIFTKTESLLALQPLLPALDRDYPAAMVPLALRLAGLEHYHDRAMWPWLTDLYAWAAASAGEGALARRALARVASLALRDGTFYEIYEGDRPAPVTRRLYRAEPDFSWHAGLYLKASSVVDPAALADRQPGTATPAP